jgi:tRNA (guanine-N7-)-methyltransferase
MKPKDLKSPYSWEERRPLIEDSIFFIPPRYIGYQNFSFPEWDSIFPKAQKIKIEFCSGNGKWLLDQAVNEPSTNWVACELQFDRVRKIWSKRKNLSLQNVFITAGDGHTFAEYYIPSHSIDEVYINFPDPWPKKRHEKNRIMQASFIKELHRILFSEGKVTFVTDDFDYLNWTLKRFLEANLFDFIHPDPFYLTEKEGYGSSYFNDLWKEQGKTIHYLDVKKR